MRLTMTNQKDRFNYRHAGKVALVGVALAMTSACTSDDNAALFHYETADAYRGGNLWDTWWKVPDVKVGIEPGAEDSELPADNPLYATNTAGNQRSGSQTWRCKECHGWDYKGVDGAYGGGSHNTGFPGVFNTKNYTVDGLFTAIRDGKGIGSDHAYSSVMSDSDIADLVKFIVEGTYDSDTLVNADKTVTGDVEIGADTYGAKCASCHGADGEKINFKAGNYASEFVADIASDNPWEFIHKVRFGQPDGEMPNGATHGFVFEDIKNLAAYVQTLSTPGLEGASVARGGVLWDAWWNVNGADEPTTTNPLYLNASYNTLGGAKTGSTTWRCKECHGWDYKGVNGAYATGSHATGIAGVFAATDRTAQEFIDIIGAGKLPDGTTQAGHAFVGDGLMSEGDVKDLALFIKKGLVESDDIISIATKRAKGSAVSGRGRYDGNCRTCHGINGLRINFAHDDGVGDTESVATVARDNPWELAHKIRFGQPGSDAEATEMEETFGLVTGHMPNAADAEYSEADIGSIVAYAQSLPDSQERGGQLWDTWWKDGDVVSAHEPGTTDSPFSATNPFYADNAFKDFPTNATPNTRSGSQTWRCKECHGWDAKGRDGAYGTGSHATGFIGIFSSTKTDEELYAAIADGDFDGDGVADDWGQLDASWAGAHSFATVLGADDETANPAIRDLIRYMRGLFDEAVELINADKTIIVAFDPGTMLERTRDASDFLGSVTFDATCAGCHGTNGRAINFKEGDGGEEYIGDIANDNPWELLHKIRHGQPDTDPLMPNAAGAYLDVDDMADLLLFTKKLP